MTGDAVFRSGLQSSVGFRQKATSNAQSPRLRRCANRGTITIEESAAAMAMVRRVLESFPEIGWSDREHDQRVAVKSVFQTAPPRTSLVFAHFRGIDIADTALVEVAALVFAFTSLSRRVIGCIASKHASR
jgi:Holliday junction resolvasome RuvABC endonuclease subunit